MRVDSGVLLFPAMNPGLGLGPGDSCYDPQHPWILPNIFHTAYECACMTRENRDTEEQCVFAMPGGTPTVYTKPKDVPSISTIIVETPQTVLGTAAKVVGGSVATTTSGLGAGLANIDWKGVAVIAGIGVAALMVFTTVLGGSRR